MIDGGRNPGREEIYVDGICKYAKLLGCEVKYYDIYNMSGEGYESITEIHGRDYVSPDFFAATIFYGNTPIAQIKYDGNDRCEHYASIFDRERFKFLAFSYFTPVSFWNKMLMKIKHIFTKKNYFYYNVHGTVIYNMLPNYYQIKKSDLTNPSQYWTDNDMKDVLKYLISENQKILKEYREFNKLKEIEEDFK